MTRAARDARDDQEYTEFLRYYAYLDLPIGPRRYLRDMNNPVEALDETQFFYRFRFSKYVFMDVVFALVMEELGNETMRGLPLPPVMKLLVVLRFYATGCFQMVCGDLVQIDQSTVSRLIEEVSTLFARHVSSFVKFPEDLSSTRRSFFQMAQFPGVIGCIDCTHVPIKNPGGPVGLKFKNRKGWSSVNVQAVVGPEGMIFDLVARWPGSVHDSRIFDTSGLKAKMEAKELQGLLLGDSGYPQSEYLFTPAPEPVLNQRQARYNRSHRSTRNCVERFFGRWKKRFPCLSRQLNTKILTSLMIISACAVLHNISVQTNEVAPDEHVEELFQQPIEPPQNELGRGRAIRNAFIADHF